jgi:hypothetical protein
MDWMEFIASLVDSLAWPAAVLAVVFILRKKLALEFGRLTQRSRMTRLKAGPAGVEFELQEATREADEARLPSTDSPQVKEVVLPLPEQRFFAAAAGRINEERLLEIAEVEPDVAMIASWRGLTHEVRNAGRGAGVRPQPSEHAIAVAERLRAAGRIDDSFLATIRTLDALGRSADFLVRDGLSVHKPEHARQYVELAFRAIAALKEIQ